MSELRELYQDVIVDHGRHPRNFGTLQDANLQKEGYNPLCGDKLTLQLLEKNNQIDDVKFEGCGCAISMASASMMTESIKGKTFSEIVELFTLFHQLVTNQMISDEQKTKLGKLMVLAGVAEFPMRVKCATLAWHTLHAALRHDSSIVSTENK